MTQKRTQSIMNPPMEKTATKKQRTGGTDADKFVLKAGHRALMDTMRHYPSDVVIEVEGELFHANWRYLERRSKYFAANKSFLEASSTDSNSIKVLPPAPALFKDALWFLYTQELYEPSKLPINFVGNFKNAQFLGMDNYIKALEVLYIEIHQALRTVPDFKWTNIPIKEFGHLLARLPPDGGRTPLIVRWARGLPDYLVQEVRSSLPAWLRTLPWLKPDNDTGLTLSDIKMWMAKDAEMARKIITVESTLKAVKQMISNESCSNCNSSFHSEA